MWRRIMQDKSELNSKYEVAQQQAKIQTFQPYTSEKKWFPKDVTNSRGKNL